MMIARAVLLAVLSVAPPVGPAMAIAPAAEAATPIRLLIVAPAAWCEALEPFAAFKRTRPGIAAVELAPLEALLTQGEGCDAPERLKHALFDRRAAGGLDAVLLVGDADVLPVRYMVLDRVAEAAFDTAFYPSDLYYADLAKADGSFEDWNGAKDGIHARYFGEVHGEKNKQGPINYDGIDYLPEIAVGRWPVSSVDEAVAVAVKSQRHEEATDGADAASEAATCFLVQFVASGGWVDNGARIRGVAAGLGAPWTARMAGYFDAEHPPTEAAVRTAIESGARIVFHTGHGQPHGWDGCLGESTLEASAGRALLPVLFSIGCSTAETATQAPYQAYIDVDGVDHEGTNSGEVFTTFPSPPAPIQTGRCNTTSVGERSVRRPNGGAVAYIGCVTGSQPCAQSLLDGFVASMSAHSDATVGEHWCSAVRHYHDAERLDALVPTDDWYPPSIYFQGMKFILFGDPTVRLTRVPRPSRP